MAGVVSPEVVDSEGKTCFRPLFLACRWPSLPDISSYSRGEKISFLYLSGFFGPAENSVMLFFNVSSQARD